MIMTSQQRHRPVNHSLEHQQQPSRVSPDLLLHQQDPEQRSISSPPTHPLFDSSSADIRLAHGQCPSCGQQLFQLKEKQQKHSKGLKGFLHLRKNSDASASETIVVRKALNVEGHVVRGQCLDCRGGTTKTAPTPNDFSAINTNSDHSSDYDPEMTPLKIGRAHV